MEITELLKWKIEREESDIPLIITLENKVSNADILDNYNTETEKIPPDSVRLTMDYDEVEELIQENKQNIKSIGLRGII